MTEAPRVLHFSAFIIVAICANYTHKPLTSTYMCICILISYDKDMYTQVHVHAHACTGVKTEVAYACVLISGMGSLSSAFFISKPTQVGSTHVHVHVHVIMHVSA